MAKEIAGVRRFAGFSVSHFCDSEEYSAPRHGAVGRQRRWLNGGLRSALAGISMAC